MQTVNEIRLDKFSLFFRLIQMESTLFGGTKQALAENLLGRVVGELQIMYTGVHRRIASGASVDFTHDRQARMEIGEAARRKRAAACRELQKCFSLITSHVHQNIYKADEARAGMGEGKSLKVARQMAHESTSLPVFAVS